MDDKNQSFISRTPGKLSKCRFCKKLFYFQAQHQHLQCEPFQSFDGNEYAQILTVGGRCPHCEKWLHLGYLNEDLLKRQSELRNNRQRRAFERDYHKWQVEARGALGIAVAEEI